MTRKILSIEGWLLSLLLPLWVLALVTRISYFYLAIVCCWFFLFLSYGTGKLNRINYFSLSYWPLIGLMIWTWVTILYAVYPEEAIYRCKITLPYITFFFLSYVAIIKNDIGWFNRLIFIVPTIFNVLFLYVIVKFGNTRGGWDFMGSLSNVGPATLVPLIPYCIYRSTAFKDRIARIALVLILLNVLTSLSRGGWLAAVLSVILSLAYLDLKFKQKCLFILKYAFLAVIPASILLFIGRSTIPAIKVYVVEVFTRLMESQLFNLFTTNRILTQTEPDYVRSAMYMEGLAIIKEYPLLGIGFGGLAERMEEFYGFYVISHNILITAWGELGVVGLILTILIFLLPLRAINRLRKNIISRENSMLATSIFVGLLVLLFHGMFVPQLTNPVLFILLGMAYGLTSKKRDISDTQSYKVLNKQSYDF